MSIIRRLLLAFILMAGISPALAQAPPPVPALPDTQRLTTYSIGGTTCACAVNFALYGDSTDYASWVEVYLNNVRVNFNDPSLGWTITSPTGPLSTIPRPITDAVLTFNAVQTGTVQIVGARRPRRTSQFSENRGVAARDLNQTITDLVAVLREMWDKQNDVTGRSLIGIPGETFGTLPPASVRAGQYLCFNGSGAPALCVVASGGTTFASGNGITFTGSGPTVVSTNLANGTGIVVTPSGAAAQIGLANMAANSAKCNNTGSPAAPIDCTGAQVAASLGLALTPFTNTFTIGHTIATTDCGGEVQMGTGNTSQITLTLPGVGGFTAPCPIRVYNGNAYSNGNSRGVIMSGFPGGVFYILFPGQSFDIRISGGAWVVDRTAGRFPQPGVQLFAANGGSDTANDCLSAVTPCLTINHAMNALLVSQVDNLNGSPIIFLAPGSTFAECVVAQGQMTGVNVGFIEGNAGQATWNTSGACAAFLISDNAEWETQNITFESTTANGFGIFIHQTGVVDMLSATNFGAFSGTGSAVGSDHGGFINFDEVGGPVNIGPGAIGTFLAIGPGTQMVGNFTATFVGSPTLGKWMTISGAGAMANFSGLANSGAATVGQSTCNGPNGFTLGSSYPGGAPAVTLGCQSE